MGEEGAFFPSAKKKEKQPDPQILSEGSCRASVSDPLLPPVCLASAPQRVPGAPLTEPLAVKVPPRGSLGLAFRDPTPEGEDGEQDQGLLASCVDPGV